MSEAVARVLSKYPQDALILVLEGENRSGGLMLALIFLFMYIPMVVGAAVKGTLLQAAMVATGVAVVAVLIFWGMGRQPTDIVVAVDGLHLFWRLGAKVKHQLVPLPTLGSVQLGAAGMSSDLLRPVDIYLVSGQKLRLRLARATKAGTVSAYKVLRNTSGQTFSEFGRDPNHARAFKAVLEALLQRGATG